MILAIRLSHIFDNNFQVSAERLSPATLIASRLRNDLHIPSMYVTEVVPSNDKTINDSNYPARGEITCDKFSADAIQGFRRSDISSYDTMYKRVRMHTAGLSETVCSRFHGLSSFLGFGRMAQPAGAKVPISRDQLYKSLTSLIPSPSFPNFLSSPPQACTLHIVPQRFTSALLH